MNKTAKIAIDALRSRALRREQLRTQVQLKVAGMFDSPTVQAAVERLKARAGTAVDRAVNQPVVSGIRQANNLIHRISPRVRQVLLGMGSGAAVGMGADLAMGRDEKGRHHYGRSALMGGTIGGITGGLMKSAAMGTPFQSHSPDPTNSPLAAAAAKTQSAQPGLIGKQVIPKVPGAAPPPNATAFGQSTMGTGKGMGGMRPFGGGPRKSPAQTANGITQHTMTQPGASVGMGYKQANSPMSPAPQIDPNMAPPIPGGPGQAQGQPMPPALAQLAQGGQQAPPKSPEELLHELPHQLTQELQTKQQHLHTMLGDPNVQLADKLQALGKMLKGLPDPPKDPMAMLTAGGMAQPMQAGGAPKMAAGALDMLKDAGSGVLQQVKDRLADPNTRIPTATLLGAGAGGLASVTAEAVGKRKNKRYLNAALTGGAAGAMLGGGGSYLAGEMGKGGAPKQKAELGTDLTGAADSLLGAVGSNPNEQAEALNKLTKSTQPSLGEAAYDATSSVAGAAPLTAAAAVGLGSADAVRGATGAARAWQFQNRSQLKTDPLATPDTGLKARIMKAFGMEDKYQSSMLHRVDPTTRGDMAADRLAKVQGLDKYRDRIRPLLDKPGVQEALLTDPSKLPSAMGADPAKTQQLADRAKRRQDLLDKTKIKNERAGIAAGKDRSGIKTHQDNIKRLSKAMQKLKDPVDIKNYEARVQFEKQMLDEAQKRVTSYDMQSPVNKIKEQRRTEKLTKTRDKADFHKSLDSAMTPEARHALITDLNTRASQLHPDRTGIHHSNLRDAHLPARKPSMSLGSGVGKGIMGTAATLDALRLLSGYMSSGQEG